MNIVCIGAHPDDPESTCGGLAVKAVDAGHQVVFFFLSSGFPNEYYGDKPVIETREAQSHAACELIGAEAHFFRLPDGGIHFNKELVDRVADFLRSMQADCVVTHWPIDCHPDHQITAVLATQATFSIPSTALAYCEAAVGMQTLAFEPNRYVDISDVAQRKKDALFCHAIPGLDSWWHYHDTMERFRGAQMMVERAEAYFLLVDNGQTDSLLEMPKVLSPYRNGIFPEDFMPKSENE